jgi:hypothetical protein
MREIAVEVDGESYQLEVLERASCEECGTEWSLGVDEEQKTCPECGHSPSEIDSTQVIIEPPSRQMDGITNKEELAQQFEERADYLNRTAKAIRGWDEEWTYVGADLLDAGILVKTPEEDGKEVLLSQQ